MILLRIPLELRIRDVSVLVISGGLMTGFKWIGRAGILLAGLLVIGPVAAQEASHGAAQIVPQAAVRQMKPVFMAYSPNGDLVAIADADRRIDVFHLGANGETVKVSEMELTIRGAIAFTPDGTRIIATGSDRIQVLRLDGQLDREWEREATGDISDITFMPDGSGFLTAGRTQPVLFWPMDGGEPQAIFYEDRQSYEAVAVSPDNSLVAVGRWDGQVTLVDLASRAVLENFASGEEGQRSFMSGILELAFTADGQRLIVVPKSLAHAGTWSLDGERISRPFAALVEGFAFRYGITDADILPGSERFVAGGGIGDPVGVFDLNGDGVPGVIELENNAHVSALKWAPDGERIAVARYGEGADIVDLQGERVADPIRGPGHQIFSLNATPDGQRLAASFYGLRHSEYASNIVGVWELDGRRVSNRFSAGNTSILHITIHPDGEEVAINQRGVSRWSVEGKPIALMPVVEDESTRSIAYSTDGLSILFGGSQYGGRISDDPPALTRLWTVSGTPGRSETSPHEEIYSIAALDSEDGYITGSTSGRVGFVDGAGRRDRRRGFDIDRSGAVLELDASPDGSRIITGHPAGGVMLWSERGRQLDTIRVGGYLAIQGVEMLWPRRALVASEDSIFVVDYGDDVLRIEGELFITPAGLAYLVDGRLYPGEPEALDSFRSVRWAEDGVSFVIEPEISADQMIGWEELTGRLFTAETAD